MLNITGHVSPSISSSQAISGTKNTGFYLGRVRKAEVGTKAFSVVVICVS